MLSPLEKQRLIYKPTRPDLLQDLDQVSFVPKQVNKKGDARLQKQFSKTFDQPQYVLQKGKATKKSLKIGVVFSGGPAPGGHNVIAALFDTGATLLGFLNGPSGIVENQTIAIQTVDAYRNQGGFDLLGSGRTKIETEEQLSAALKTVKHHALDGLVIIGGDDSNTNAAVLAEYFLHHGCSTKVIGVPKTIDGDLRSEEIEISFGFDSASKTYAEMIGNIAKDALSAKKYYHFIRLMGRSASHIALECAFLTRPNLTLISEEKKSADEVIKEIADLIEKRHKLKKDYGIILLPEGLVESMPELLKDMEKDPHGNVQISQVETEKVLIDLVQKELKRRGFQGKLNPLAHFFGYEGRSCLPTNFDANYCYALGLVAALAIRDGLTGVICSLQHLDKPPREWTAKAIPIIQLMHLEMRSGAEKPVIQKALVDIKGKAFSAFLKLKEDLATEDSYSSPGPIQFFGDTELNNQGPYTLRLK